VDENSIMRTKRPWLELKPVRSTCGEILSCVRVCVCVCVVSVRERKFVCVCVCVLLSRGCVIL
jgi:hypothetical protein